jgi:hypothetical protein
MMVRVTSANPKAKSSTGMSHGTRHPLYFDGSYRTTGADSLVSQPSTRHWKNTTMA